MQAQDVLREMVAHYAALTSYVDTGMVTTHLDSSLTRRITFSTLYQKPSFFRFSFSKPHPHPPLSHLMTETTVGSDGIRPYYLRRESGAGRLSKPVDNLQLAVAAATGISSGSVHTIGRLLLPVVEGTSILDLTDPQFNADADIEGVSCFSITAQHPRAGTRVLMIEKHRLLLRKLTKPRDNGRSEEVRENISINQPLEPTMFAAPGTY